MPTKTKEKPLDPDVEKVRRKLIRFMGINLGLLFLALMVVIGALVYKARNAPAPTPPLAGDIQVPGGGAACRRHRPAGGREGGVSHPCPATGFPSTPNLPTAPRVLFVYDIAERQIVGRFAIRNK